jgi:hypothetical protein
MSDWNAPICLRCWFENYPDRGDPVRVKSDDAHACRWCGTVTAAGIYVRHDPTTVPMPREREQS